MKCPNPDCGNIIPNDSKFCPDCGQVIENEDDIRNQAIRIATQYKNGYEYYVNNGTIPQLSQWLSLEAYKAIISNEDAIVNKNQELLSIERNKQRHAEEERRKNNELEKQRLQKQKQEEERNIKKEAQFIVGTWSKGYEYFVSRGELPGKSSLSNINACNRIILKKSDIVSKDREISETQLRERAEKIKQECGYKEGRDSGCLVFAFTVGFFDAATLSIIFGGLQISANLISITISLVISTIAWFYISSALFDRKPRGVDKIRKWKQEHPNDPVCKYL